MSKPGRNGRALEVARRRIIDAAMGLFHHGGQQSVTMRAIAGRIDCSPAAIYHSFPGKEAIVEELRQEGFRMLAIRLQGLRDVRPADARLRLACRAYVEFAQGHPDLYGLMFMDVAAGSAPFASGSAGMAAYDAFASLVRACLPEGAAADPATASLALWASLHGLAAMALGGSPGVAPPQELPGMLEDALGFLLRGLIT